MSCVVREEKPGDAPAVHVLNRLAFGQEQEAELVDALRRKRAILLSLVATIDDEIVGHVVYSPVTIAGRHAGAALGPMAVLPRCQRQGVGSKLVRAGNDRLRRAGCPYIVVLGHAGYYPRFGFRPASELMVTCEWEVPDEVFMLLVLDAAAMSDVSGEARYRPEFSTIG